MFEENFFMAYEKLNDTSKKEVQRLCLEATMLAEKHPTQPDPNKWGDMYDTICAIELSEKIKSIVFGR